MADSRSIGVFDSGVGGLTVLEAIHQLLPSESTIYLGDLARCPYGSRPRSEVQAFALQVSDFLASLGIKLLVVACNTATAAAYNQLRDRYDFPVIGVVEPGARAAVHASGTRRFGVTATNGTVESHAYRDSILRMAPEAEVVELPASWLVPVIESGETDSAEVRERLRSQLAELDQHDIDTLILGCTHFPLIRDMFAEFLGDAVTIVDSAGTTAHEVDWLLRELDIQSDSRAEHRVLVTGEPGPFAARAKTMFHASLEIETTDLVRRAGAGSLQR